MYSQLPKREIYKKNSSAEKNPKKTDKEMQLLDRQIGRADLEIEILEHKLEVGAWSQDSH